MYEVMPFDNTLVKMKMTGADILKNIEHGIGNEDVGNASFSGLIVNIDADKPFGERVLSMTLSDGTPLDMNKMYSVVINDFMYPTGDNFDFTGATDVVDTFIPIRDVLVDAVKASGKIVASPVTSIVESPMGTMAKYDTYKVVSGDVLWKIANMYGVDYEMIANMNALDNPNLIYPGQMLMVPAQ